MIQRLSSASAEDFFAFGVDTSRRILFYNAREQTRCNIWQASTRADVTSSVETVLEWLAAVNSFSCSATVDGAPTALLSLKDFAEQGGPDYVMEGAPTWVLRPLPLTRSAAEPAGTFEWDLTGDSDPEEDGAAAPRRPAGGAGSSTAPPLGPTGAGPGRPPAAAGWACQVAFDSPVAELGGRTAPASPLPLLAEEDWDGIGKAMPLLVDHHDGPFSEKQPATVADVLGARDFLAVTALGATPSLRLNFCEPVDHCAVGILRQVGFVRVAMGTAWSEVLQSIGARLPAALAAGRVDLVPLRRVLQLMHRMEAIVPTSVPPGEHSAVRRTGGHERPFVGLLSARSSTLQGAAGAGNASEFTKVTLAGLGRYFKDFIRAGLQADGRTVLDA